MGFSADVRDFDAIAAGVNDLKINMGEFDAVISGAAGNFPAMANDLSPNGFKSVVDIDLRGFGQLSFGPACRSPKIRKPFYFFSGRINHVAAF